MIILAMGKLGGREPNYHSDLDVIFLYEAGGNTKPVRRNGRDNSTTNQHFFSQFGQRITSYISRLGPQGRLYEMDARLRPTGKSGALACSLDEFARYFSEGAGQLWERQALCKARPISGSKEARDTAMRVVRDIFTSHPWKSEFTEEIRHMRSRMEETASKRNLKRGPGGTVDLEFMVQMLQLKHIASTPDVLTPGTLDAVSALHDAGHLGDDDYAYLNRSYRFLRSIEAGLRLMNTAARHDLPEDENELKKLAFLLGLSGPGVLVEKCGRYTQENRERFNRIFDEAKALV
jgi:glutamate-ammonia-ligase adenylyltransferase